MNRIKELRNKANLTVRELSKYSNIDYSYLSKLEKGRRNLTEEMAIKLAKFFSVNKEFVEGKNQFIITCHTSDLKQTFPILAFDIQKYGDCYNSKLNNGIVINIINKNIENKLLKEKDDANELFKKLMSEKEIVDHMDEWSEVNLIYALNKINRLLKKR